MEVRIGEATVQVIQGDICDCATDAIVNAANNHLWMGGGVAGAIKRRGGLEIEREAIRQGPIPVGAAVATGAGSLPASAVIHAAVMGQDLVTDADLIRRATASALELAESMRLESIAFPALGTGVGGFPLRECAALMLEAVASHAAAARYLTTIEFVLFDQQAFDAFAAVLRESEARHGGAD